jgi:hypothetical protein
MRSSALILTAALLLAGAARLPGAEGVDEVVRLAQGGLGEDVVLAFIDTSPVAYELSVADIVWLNDLGISEKVIAAMINHGKALREKAAAAPALEPGAEIAEAPPAPKPEPAVEPAPAPAPAEAPVADAPGPVYEVGAQPAPEDGGDGIVYRGGAPPVVVVPAGDANITYFYRALSPYGMWVSDGTYGWVWQPTAGMLDVEWRPYCHSGRWMWTDYGWYWHSEYSWGWAPFHYGRWVHHPRHRWV